MVIGRNIKKQARALVVARMSPRLNARTRFEVETLARDIQVTVVSEAPNIATGAPPQWSNVRLIEMQLAFPGHSVWHLAGALRIVQLSLRAVLELFLCRYDIVVCHDVPYCMAGFFAKIVLRRKFVFNAHEIIWALGAPATISRFLKWIERLVLRTCDLWLVPSEERAELTLQEQRLVRSYVVYENFPVLDPEAMAVSQLSAEKQAPIVDRRKPVLMFLGSLEPKRGLEELVEAARSADYRLVVQGKGPLWQYLQDHAHDNMTLLPACPNNQVVRQISTADLSFIYYENDCLNSAYACSNKLYAAVFAGVPVVCNRLPAFEAFAEKHGGIVFIDNLTPESINSAVSGVLEDSARYQRLKQEMRLLRADWLKHPRAQILRAAFDKLLQRSSNEAFAA